jgi:2-polyprenyl-6-methoxyphenol hydroxylase-like FAD-dependent oxidoreductase
MNFVRLLEYRVKEPDFAPYITLITNTEAADIQRLPSSSSSSSDAKQVQVTLRNTVTGNTQRFAPKLLLGCDGMNSIVRHSLQDWAAEDANTSSSSSSSSTAAANGSSSSSTFGMVEYPSLSTNLRFKVLQLPPNPPMKDGTVLCNPSFCMLAGQKSKLIGGPPLRLGLLPIKDESAGRTANLITLPDHPVRGVRDAATLYKVFEEAFPQADWRVLVPEPVMEKVGLGLRCSCCAFEYSNSNLGAIACQPAGSLPFLMLMTKEVIRNIAV